MTHFFVLSWFAFILAFTARRKGQAPHQYKRTSLNLDAATQNGRHGVP
jgi:hypothetical protein